MTQPQLAKYAQSGDVSIAYQVTGDGPLDLIVSPGYVSHVDHAWEEPSFARCLKRLASFSRLIRDAQMALRAAQLKGGNQVIARL